MSDNKEKIHFRLWQAFAATAALLIILFCAFTTTRAISFKRTTLAAELTREQAAELSNLLINQYPDKYEYLKALPYNIKKPELDIWAKAAILIDVSNGNILYQRNADEVIPPASMTKLFAMYVVEEEIASGRFT